MQGLPSVFTASAKVIPALQRNSLPSDQAAMVADEWRGSSAMDYGKILCAL